MAYKLNIKGIEAYEGEYDFDLSYEFTNRELQTIKRLSGLRRNELDEAFVAGDTDLYVAFAVICLQRAGKFVDEDLIWDGPVGAIEIGGDEAEADADPLALPNDGVESSGSAEKNDSSGPSGMNGSDSLPESPPRATGGESSAPSVPSVPGTWAT